jgi:hypothetical protein
MSAAAVFTAAVSLAAGGAAMLVAGCQLGWRRALWLAIGGGCVAYGALDLFAAQPTGLSYVAASAIAALFIIAVAGSLWSVPGGARLAMVSALLLASNPLFGTLEIGIAADSTNYYYVAVNQPYELSGAAWNALWGLSHLQEASEALAMALLLRGFLLAGAATLRSADEEAASTGEAASTAS